MRVRETELPGVGVRYDLSFDGGGALVVVIENDGARRVYWRADEDSDSEKLFEAGEPEARKIAEIFDGTYFTPVAEDIEEVFEDARIKWILLSDVSPLVGQTIEEAGIRTKTGVSVIAIERGARTMANPTKDSRFQADDVIVVVGSDEQHSEFSKLL
jgi:TrkA domain protein